MRMRDGMTDSQHRLVGRLYSGLRSKGVPSLVSQGEAHRLSAGETGRENDWSGALSLAGVCMAIVKSGATCCWSCKHWHAPARATCDAIEHHPACPRCHPQVGA